MVEINFVLSNFSGERTKRVSSLLTGKQTFKDILSYCLEERFYRKCFRSVFYCCNFLVDLNDSLYDRNTCTAKVMLIKAPIYLHIYFRNILINFYRNTIFHNHHFKNLHFCSLRILSSP